MSRVIFNFKLKKYRSRTKTLIGSPDVLEMKNRFGRKRAAQTEVHGTDVPETEKVHGTDVPETEPVVKVTRVHVSFILRG